MHFPFMRSSLAATVAVVLTGLSGCASKPEPMPEPELPEIERAMDVGVNYIEPESDIVIMDPSYQHVVLPDGVQVAYRPGWEEEALAAVANNLNGGSAAKGDKEAMTEKRKVGPTSEDVAPEEIPPVSLADLPTAEESDDPIYKAWRKLCEMKPEDLTRAEMQIVLHNAMPEELEGLCEEGRRWLAELK